MNKTRSEETNQLKSVQSNETFEKPYPSRRSERIFLSESKPKAKYYDSSSDESALGTSSFSNNKTKSPLTKPSQICSENPNKNAGYCCKCSQFFDDIYVHREVHGVRRFKVR